MPRPERPLEGLGGPVEQLAAGLRELRERAGRPGYRQMAARVNYSVATLSAAASGRRLPTWEVTLAYVTACGGDREEWERRWREAERLTTAPAENPGVANGHCAPPYPGLAAFQPRDAELFFGRAALVGELTRRLRERRFLAVFGPSGVGKSSVVRAGLVPAAGGPAVVLTPGAHPMAELAVHLARHAGVACGGLLDELRADPARASLLVRQGMCGVPADVDLLVVVDQFEEAFATCADAAERADFVAALLAMCQAPDARARVVLATRADHFVRFTEHPALLAALTDAQLLIGGMSPAELREAVTGPAERCGARVEGALVATIVAEVTDRPGALPLAAHALRQAWHRRKGTIVTLSGYEVAGGMAGAVAHTAEEAYERLSVRERHVARQVLRRMVDVGEDGLITRRRLYRTELDAIGHAPAVVDTLAAARLVTTDRDTVEIAHEALIHAWPRLRGWVETDRAGLRLHRQLTEAATVWETLGRDDGALYRGVRLAMTAEAADAKIIDLTGTESAFLEASLALRDRETRQRRRRARRLLTALTAVLTLVLSLAAGAVASALRAESERSRATARELAAAARAERMTDPDLALLLALRAYRLHPDAETESVLRQATAHSRTVSTFASHDAEVRSIDVSGSQIASADADGVVKVWDTQRRTPPVTAPVSGRFVDFGPAGMLALTCYNPSLRASSVVLWRPGDTGPGRRLEPPAPAALSRVAYSEDGRWVAAVADDDRVYVWDTATDGGRTSIDYTGDVGGLAFGPDGRLAVASDDGTVRVWRAGTAAPPVLIRQAEETYPSSVAFSPDGRSIAVGGYEKVSVWSADGRSGPRIYLGPELWYTSVAFSPDGLRIAAGTAERTVRIWTMSDGTRPRVPHRADGGHGTALRGHHGTVRDLAFSPDGRRLISGSDDTTVRVWDTTAEPETMTLADAARISEDGSVVASSAGPGAISVFPVRTPGTATMLRGGPPGPLSLAVGPGGRGVATASPGSPRIHWWDTAGAGDPAVVDCGSDPATMNPDQLLLGADGRTLVTDCGDNEIRLWRSSEPHDPTVIRGDWPVAVDGAGGLMAVRVWPQDMVLWDPAADRLVRTLHARADQARFSPDGRLLALSGDDGTIRVWTVAEAADPVVLTGAVGRISAIAFSPDGRLIAAIGTDDVLRIWNTDGSGEPLTFDQPAGTQQVAFSADGRQLITLHGTHLRFTPCEVCGPVDEVLRLAQQRTTRDFTPGERTRYLHDPG
ncbi:nSTAND1 domain-containing NTPase [Catenuloplanes atrovinosus]|uniref:WD40 repeat protein n=1 Tax=Catenuloplanes atrovinosus TaxID=137266 RepID=A0AAE3YKY9_9ACTN|nr:hypothetical protein [Catenuloplanes atrovinosus]MDR7275375.1 WD40 repeat protein [Catenuloplanes atrovinosus]